MKIPYIKLYTADLLAASRHLTAQQIGQAVLGICEQAFEDDCTYLPQTQREKQFFQMLGHWKEEAQIGYAQKKKAGRLGGKTKQQKMTKIDGSGAISSACSTPPSQTETDTKTETKPYTETKTEKNNTLTARAENGPAQGTQDFSSLKKQTATNPLQTFAAQVLACFEPTVQTPAQREIWLKRNARCLKDILRFCGENIPLALQTIRVCARRLEKAGLSGGYEAVCRNLPEYHDQAQAELAHV